jgi:hypothetical protein
MKKAKIKEDRRRIRANDPQHNAKFNYAVSFIQWRSQRTVQFIGN